MRDIFLTIGGSDSSSGAGIQADIKTANNIGVHVCTVISCVTAQNSTSILNIEKVYKDSFKEQIQAISSDFKIKVIKTSVLSSIEQIDIVVDLLNDLKDVFYICDPVMVSTTGYSLVDYKLAEYSKRKLYPLANILVPNLDEAKTLLDEYDSSNMEVVEIAKAIQKKYNCKSVLLKGGHDSYKNISLDYYYSPEVNYKLISTRHKLDEKVRGTGCTFSSAIASFLTLGFDINNSIVLAKSYISNAIKSSQKIASHGCLIVGAEYINKQGLFPKVSMHGKDLNIKFRSINKIGFYPIVDNASKIPGLANLGIKTIQLRIKSNDNKHIQKHIVEAVEYQNKYGLQLFINDYYDLAIKYKAFGIHLGHEDLLSIDKKTLLKIKNTDMALGLSTHDYYELAIALGVNPSYVALGPIYTTTTKKMKFAPQGIARIHEWLNITDTPLVTIGGIKKRHIQSLASIGVDGVAVVTLIDEISNHEIQNIVKLLEK
ncbi:bifunctional hydroxymethylpyrimidine kinase/phosphomethylpyrimidine kinase [Francisella hispaniensis]|uniref:hydroxymethylpyrimidine kinase n=1 Tax=Francisella hispaniensis FSC454 TaxID=1088883 RepID=A0AAC9J532_9GAMM|nr:bifunctional hydroxymethylpyrimidine kinase/phosphomethylpyrimidine kinase [Francisella hispaniensis]APD50389.1 bifunctional hydroxymethylpyrimidine kinase/phosphomethylpyrimidine kinase [Francisella hispaniensis FSC454]KYW82591.1 bifunctional hydroxymethylpyrimidine kinase/phosphomethylpyrimidine kinase [Francisella hispaniensis FSC454]